MRYHLSAIPRLLGTPVGRWQLGRGLWFRCWPVLSRLAWLHRRTLARRARVVAVVGTYGKTTTARATLAALGLPLRRHNQSNAWSNLAAALLRVTPWHRGAVLEVGIDRVGQMARYADIVRPDVVVVTSIGSEHHRALGTLETTRAEKAAMLRALPPTGFAVLNGDDPHVLWMKSQTGARIVTFGCGDANDVRATQVELDWPRGTWFRLLIGGESRDVRLRLIGQTMVYPALAAIAVGCTAGLGLDEILLRLAQLPPTPGRLEPVALPNGAWILRDDFKSGLETIYAALAAFEQIPATRRLLVLGDVAEPPGRRGPIYRELGERAAHLVDRFVVVGTGFSPYAVGAKRGGLTPAALRDAGRHIARAVALLRDELQPGDVVLIKGRHDQRLERISLALQGQAVQCDIKSCEVKVRSCASCPMLKRGWPSRKAQP